MSKNTNTAAAQLAPEAPPAAKKKRVRNRGAKAVAGGPSPVAAAESAAARIEALLEGIKARSASLLEAQRAKPGRWDYFAAIADLEERIRRVLP